MLHSLNGLLLAASLAAMAGSLWNRDRLPGPEAVLDAVRAEPLQQPVVERAFVARAGGVDYTVRPSHRYELVGLVVSRHDTSVWWDVVHRDAWKDHLNVADLCVVWGRNLEDALYRRMRYASGTFTCSVATDSPEDWRRFDPSAISNNHLLASDPALARTLRAIRPGDQIRVAGRLVEYAHDVGAGFRRGTSTRRDDTGDGACETIWVTEAQVLRAANRGWRAMRTLAWIGIAAAIALWLLLPPRPVR